jgi:hypothetical protein
VGIENNDGRDFKDLRGMRQNSKSLKRNDGARKEVLIAPLQRPQFFLVTEFFLRFFRPLARMSARLQVQISRHGWLADAPF